ncbi:hypothetical protein LCGC14_3132130, partial [marine sediment metagenome]
DFTTRKDLLQMSRSSVPLTFEQLSSIFREGLNFMLRDNDMDAIETFMNDIMDYNPAFSLFFTNLYDTSRHSDLNYFLIQEKGFEDNLQLKREVYENVWDEIAEVEKINQYFTGRGASWISALNKQTQLLLVLWDGRDALTGIKLIDEDGILLENIVRHHYEILYFEGRKPRFIKFDCRLEAQVPLNGDSHGRVKASGAGENPQNYADLFRDIMEKLMRGEWATPRWWKNSVALRSFEGNLIRLGFTKPT